MKNQKFLPSQNDRFFDYTLLHLNHSISQPNRPISVKPYKLILQDFEHVEGRFSII